MASKYHKKIEKILKESDLPDELLDDLRKELESHFYEKEQSLQFKGLEPQEIQSQIEKDFGDDEMIGATFQFVHKKSLYSFVKYLMKHFSIITGSIFQFILGFLLLEIFILNDVTSGFLERLVYYLLAFIPFMASILVMYKKKNYKTAFLTGGMLYLLSALILYSKIIIDASISLNFFGVSFQMAFFAMAIHALVLLSVLISIHEKSKKEKVLNK